LIPKFASEVRRVLANFGIGTLLFSQAGNTKAAAPVASKAAGRD